MYDYMDNKTQPDLNHNMRSIIVDWLIEVAEEYRKYVTSTQTIQLAVNYMDRYLSKEPIKRGRLQLVGVAAMLSAAKFEEIWPPGVDDYVYIADNTYKAEEVKRMERSILNTLSFRLAAATPHDFLQYHMLLMKREFPQKKVRLRISVNSQLLVELCMQRQLYIQRLPSEVAAMALWLARRYDNLPGWSPELALQSEYTEIQVAGWASCLHKLVQEQLKKSRTGKGGCRCQSILNKYLRTVKKHKLPLSWMLTNRTLPKFDRLRPLGSYCYHGLHA